MKPTTGAITDVSRMRALAHPLRLTILGELRVNGPATAGRLGDVVDEAPGTLSYHLGKLAEAGFVEEAPELSTDRRERWWRAVHESTEIATSGEGLTPGERAASAALRHRIVDVYATTLHRVVDADQVLPAEWVEASVGSDTLAFLTVGELAEASAELGAVLEKWHARGDRSRAGAEPVQLMAHAFRRP
jgi:DNA-binding transcriptional ArsR family regulator